MTKKRIALLAGLAVIFILICAGALLLLQQHRLNSAAKAYNQSLNKYVANLANDPTSYTHKPALTHYAFAFLSPSYQKTERKQAVVNENATYLAALDDGLHGGKGSTFSAGYYTVYLKEYGDYGAAIGQFDAGTADLSDASIASSAKTFFTSQSKSMETFETSVNQLKNIQPIDTFPVKHLKQEIQTAKAQLAKCESEASNADTAKAAADATSCETNYNDLLRQISDVSNDILMFPYEFKDVDTMKITAQRLPVELSSVSANTPTAATRLATAMDTRSAVMQAMVPTTKTDANYTYKGQVLRATTYELDMIIDAAQQPKTTADALHKKVAAIRASSTMFGDPSGGSSAGGFENALTAADMADSPNGSDDFTGNYQAKYNSCQALVAPAYVAQTVQQVCQNYKKAHDISLIADRYSPAKASGGNLLLWEQYSQQALAYHQAAESELQTIADMLNNDAAIAQSIKTQFNDLTNASWKSS